MIECDIKGCGAFLTEPGRIHLLDRWPFNRHSNREEMKHWIILKPCLCGGETGENCKCNLTVAPLWGIVPVQHWPNLDWWTLGGVDRLVLCPDHKVLVSHEILRQRGLDPTMNPGGNPDPTNRH